MPQRRKSIVKRAAEAKMRALREQAERAALQVAGGGMESPPSGLEPPVSPARDEGIDDGHGDDASASSSDFALRDLGVASTTHGALGHLGADGVVLSCPVSAVQAKLQLGDRWIGTASVTELLRECPLWVHQRPVDAARVQEIADVVAAALMATQHAQGEGESVACPLPGSVSVFSIATGSAGGVAPPQQCAILDGQHRVLALHGLVTGTITPAATTPTDSPVPTEAVSEAASWIPPTDFEVVVDVYSVPHWTAAKGLFLQLNSAESIPEIDLPEALAPDHKTAIDTAVASLTSEFPACFSSSSRCRPPHLHAPTLRNDLLRTGIVKRKRLSSAALLDELRAANAFSSTVAASDLPMASRGRALRKAKAHNFYLGLTRVWLDRLSRM